MDDYDPRMVAVYDEDNPDGPDHDFFRALADEIGARAIVDLGCGTGMLTVTLAAPGRTVVGVDPSVAMIDFARRRPGGGQVTWLVGDSRTVPDADHDLALMTGNVAQHIPEEDWPRTLSDLAGALRPGGVLAFEARNPAARAWEQWAAAGRTRRRTPYGELEQWWEVDLAPGGVVVLTSKARNLATGETITHVQRLVFRQREQVEAQLDGAGFDVVAVHGDWQRRPATAGGPLLLFVARRR